MADLSDIALDELRDELLRRELLGAVPTAELWAELDRRGERPQSRELRAIAAILGAPAAALAGDSRRDETAKLRHVAAAFMCRGLGLSQRKVAATLNRASTSSTRNSLAQVESRPELAAIYARLAGAWNKRKNRTK